MNNNVDSSKNGFSEKNKKGLMTYFENKEDERFFDLFADIAKIFRDKTGIKIKEANAAALAILFACEIFEKTPKIVIGSFAKNLAARGKAGAERMLSEEFTEKTSPQTALSPDMTKTKSADLVCPPKKKSGKSVKIVRRREKSRELGNKLKAIRCKHGLKQCEMLILINPNESETNRARVSQYERSRRVPSPLELSRYAAFAEITIEVLVEDNQKLPVEYSEFLTADEP